MLYEGSDAMDGLMAGNTSADSYFFCLLFETKHGTE
jgi:hypothetical protein